VLPLDLGLARLALVEVAAEADDTDAMWDAHATGAAARVAVRLLVRHLHDRLAEEAEEREEDAADVGGVGGSVIRLEL
jgi:hypothetical protein